MIRDASLRQSKVLGVPADFDELQGFNDHKRKKMKAEQMTSSELKKHADILYSFCIRPSLCRPDVVFLHDSILGLAECLKSYYTYLDEKNAAISENHLKSHPVREVDKFINVRPIPPCSKHQVREEYSKIDEALSCADVLEPVY